MRSDPTDLTEEAAGDAAFDFQSDPNCIEIPDMSEEPMGPSSIAPYMEGPGASREIDADVVDLTSSLNCPGSPGSKRYPVGQQFQE
eukprot:3023735-Pyramimonas_sp.AAC.2